MDNQLLFEMIFSVLGGLGIFLLGMDNMREGLQLIAGSTFRKLIHIMTTNRFLGLGVGALITCIVQSSSITTVMVVGLVNSELMNLSQAVGVIMGANIGTTITGWIIAIKVGKYGLPLLGVAALVWLFSKNEKLKFTALAFLGIGMIFFGLELMKDGFKPIRGMPAFEAWFHAFQADSYFGVLQCALIGCILTLIVQSSSATLGITVSLAATGIIPFETAAALVLGENIGTTITAFLATLNSGPVAKRAAYFHIIFNVLGVLWITAIFQLYLPIIVAVIGSDPNTMILVKGEETYPYIAAAIAAVHTGFNVTNTLIFLPFVPWMARLLEKVGKGKPKKETGEAYLTHLDFAIHDSPHAALEQSKHEIVRMDKHIRNMLDQLKEYTSTADRSLADKIFEREDILDGVQREITTFLTDLLSESVPHDLTMEAQEQLRMADEYESVSDEITSALKLYLRLQDAKIELTDGQKEELAELHEITVRYYDFVHLGLKGEPDTFISTSEKRSSEITDLIRDLRQKHWERLSEQKIEPLVSTIYMDLANCYRRIKDHLLNVSEAIAGKKFID